MHIFPCISMKNLAECKDGELVIYRKEEGLGKLAFVNIYQDGAVLVLLDHITAEGEQIRYPATVDVASLGLDYKIEVDVGISHFMDIGKTHLIPGWLHATTFGWEMTANAERGSIRVAIPSEDSAKSSAVGIERIVFPRWSIVIDKKTVFKFDATVK